MNDADNQQIQGKRVRFFFCVCVFLQEHGMENQRKDMGGIFVSILCELAGKVTMLSDKVDNGLGGQAKMINGFLRMMNRFTSQYFPHFFTRA